MKWSFISVNWYVMEQKIEISWIEKKFIEYSVAIDY